MARIIGNPIMMGASGKFANVTTYRRQKSGNVIMGKINRGSTVPATEKQKEVQSRFKRSIAYAKAALLDPELLKLYRGLATDDQSAYNVAVRDAARPPRIVNVNTSAYQGQPGNMLKIEAVDDYKVMSVHVSIATADGVLVEQGEALYNAGSLQDWLYTVTGVNAALAGSIITVTAKDRPGNETVLDVEL
jgi:hypothetical protein